MAYRLGINMGFAVNKYIEPEVWSYIVAEELGLKYVQFTADLLNPFWPTDYTDSQIKRIIAAKEKHGITIESIFTGALTRVNHFMHPDEDARLFWMKWFERLLEIGAAFEASSLGSHFGILTFDSYDHFIKRECLIEKAVRAWQKLSLRAKELGYKYLLFEPMSVPREMGNTVADTLLLMERVNSGSSIPMYCCLDIGHAPDPDERDPYPWILKLGSVSPIIHVQQTVLNRSNHSPFTAEFNSNGIIQGERVLEALKASGNTDALLCLEIFHREHFDTEFRIIEDLKESVCYWRNFVSD